MKKQNKKCDFFYKNSECKILLIFSANNRQFGKISSDVLRMEICANFELRTSHKHLYIEIRTNDKLKLFAVNTKTNTTINDR